MSRFRNQHNWNEFRWENEIRSDERRINRYFAELASCLDLPGEEEIIAGLISETQGLVPAAASGSAELFRPWSYLAAHDEEQDYEEDCCSRRPEQALVNLLDTLAVSWNRLWVSKISMEFTCHCLGVSCAYGKLLARFADFADADAEKEKGLKISLGKRTLADINELAAALRFLAENYEEISDTVNKHIDDLALVRDRIILILSGCKK